MIPSSDEQVAIFSPDRAYRYVLRRRVGLSATKLLVVMLNPSTADEVQDDPTVRRCIGYAQSRGYGLLTVCNIYGYRATEPWKLGQVDDPVGPDNDEHIFQQARQTDDVLAAWGTSGPASSMTLRATAVAGILKRSRRPVWSLGLTNSGQPRHPLYVRADVPFAPFEFHLVSTRRSQ